MDTANLHQPTPSDARDRARVIFYADRHYQLGTLTYWPGNTSGRNPNVVGDNGRRHKPARDKVWLCPPDHP